jgi:hypothetical protein
MLNTTSLIKKYSKLSLSERKNFTHKLFMLNPSNFSGSDIKFSSYEEYETDSSYIRLDTKSNEYLVTYKSINICAGYFNKYLVTIKRKDVYTIVFEIDKERNNAGGFDEIKEDGSYYYRLFDLDEEGLDFVLNDEIQEIKYNHNTLYAVTQDYYYVINNGTKLMKSDDLSEADVIKKYANVS